MTDAIDSGLGHRLTLIQMSRIAFFVGSPMSARSCYVSRSVGADRLYIALIRAAGKLASRTTFPTHLPTFHRVNVIIATFWPRSVLLILAHSLVRRVDTIGLGRSVWMKRCSSVVVCSIVAIRHCTASITHWIVQIARWRGPRRSMISGGRPRLLAAVRCTRC